MNLKKIIIIVTLIVAGISTFMFSALREPVYDDIFYLFIYSDSLWDSDYGIVERVDSFSDVVESQIYHYMHVNGRAPVHVAVQVLENLWGYTAFGVINALFFIAFVLLLAYYIKPDKIWDNPFLLLAVTLCVQYMFPYGLGCNIGPWYTVAMAVNYLWTGAFVMLFLCLWRRYNSMSCSAWACMGFCLVGLFAGWGNEAFSVSLSGGIFLYYIFFKRSFRTNSEKSLVLSLWLGTALLVFAPGTFERVGNHSDSGMIKIFTSLAECYMNVKFIWLLLCFLLLSVVFKKLSLKQFMHDNTFLWIILSVAFVFSLYAHTMPHSLLCVEIVSMILIFILFDRLFGERLVKTVGCRVYYSSMIALLLLYIVHISFVLYYNQKQYEIYRNISSGFVASPDGVVKVDFPERSVFINSFIDNVDMHFIPDDGYSYCYAVLHGNKDKTITTICSNDYDKIIENPDRFFVDDNRIQGSACMYDTGGSMYYYAPLDSLNLPSEYRVVASFEKGVFSSTLPWLRRLVYKLLDKNKPPKELDTFVMSTRSGDFLVAYKLLSTPSRIDIVPVVPEGE